MAASHRDESRVLFKEFRVKQRGDARRRVLNKLREDSQRAERLKREHDNIPELSSKVRKRGDGCLFVALCMRACHRCV